MLIEHIVTVFFKYVPELLLSAVCTLFLLIVVGTQLHIKGINKFYSLAEKSL